MVALCRCPRGIFSPALFRYTQLSFADSGFRRGPLARVTSALFPKAKTRVDEPSAEPVTVIKASWLFDGDKFRTPGVCVVKGDRIVSTSQGDAPKDATVIDLGEVTLMPGLIDAHTHVTGFMKKSPYEVLPFAPTVIADSVAESALLAFKNATTLLSNGFTTIRDVGSWTPGIDIGLRGAIEKGLVTGPRMFVAGKPLSITGGHGDDNARASWLRPDEGYQAAVAHGPYGFRELVRSNLKQHVDCIKIMATGGVLSFGDAWDAPQLNFDEIEAIVDEAHKFGLHVCAHAHGDKGISAAVKGGCDSIEHCTGVSEATATEMAQRGTYLVPTLWAADSIRQGKTGTTYPASLVAKANEACLLRDEGVQRAKAAGVRFAYGSDCAVFPHEDNNKDFGLLAEAGFAPLDILKIATANAAELLGKHDRGRIAPGLLADIVGFAGDASKSVAALGEKPFFIMLGGKALT